MLNIMLEVLSCISSLKLITDFACPELASGDFLSSWVHPPSRLVNTVASTKKGPSQKNSAWLAPFVHNLQDKVSKEL